MPEQCPNCREELEESYENITVMYDDIVEVGEFEVYYDYCSKCGWDNEKQHMEETTQDLGGSFYY